MTRVSPTIGILALLAAFAAAPASAASFDCRKAATLDERAICTSPALSRADARLAQAYAGVLGQLGPANQALMRRDEADWVKWRRQRCRQAADRMEACLESSYAARLDALANAVRTIGGTRFLMITRSYDTPTQDPGDEPYAFVTVTTPHPDGASLPAATRAWIEATDAKLAAVARTESDTEVTVTVDRLRPDLVTLRIDTTILGHLAAHAFYNWEYRHYLPKQGRELRAEDLFRPDVGWQAKLIAAVTAALAPVEAKDVDVLEACTLAPTLWSFDATGLTVNLQFPMEPATIPWTSLEPLLAMPMPFDRTRLEPLPPHR